MNSVCFTWRDLTVITVVRTSTMDETCLSVVWGSGVVFNSPAAQSANITPCSVFDSTLPRLPQLFKVKQNLFEWNVLWRLCYYLLSSCLEFYQPCYLALYHWEIQWRVWSFAVSGTTFVYQFVVEEVRKRMLEQSIESKEDKDTKCCHNCTYRMSVVLWFSSKW